MNELHIHYATVAIKQVNAMLMRSLYKNVCPCAAYEWLHHRGIGRCGRNHGA